MEEPYKTERLLPSCTAPGYKASDEVYLCKMFGGGNTSHTWRQLSPHSKGSTVNRTLPAESRKDVKEEEEEEKEANIVMAGGQ